MQNFVTHEPITSITILLLDSHSGLPILDLELQNSIVTLFEPVGMSGEVVGLRYEGIRYRYYLEDGSVVVGILFVHPPDA